MCPARDVRPPRSEQTIPVSDRLLDFTPLERQLLEMYTHGSIGPLPALRRQLSQLRVARREVTEGGMDVHFWLPIDTPLIEPFEQDHSDVRILFEGSDEWSIPTLWVEHGWMVRLSLRWGDYRTPTPIPKALVVEYYTLVPNPDDEDFGLEFPLPDRDWAEMLEYFEMKERRKGKPEGWVDPESLC